MRQSNRNISRRRNSRPRVNQDKHYVKNVVTPDTVRASRNQKTQRQKDAALLGSSIKRKDARSFTRGQSKSFNTNPHIKRLILIIAAIVVVLIVGVSIGVFTFFVSSSAKLSVGGDVDSKLVKVAEGQSYYILLAADINGDENQDPEMLMLARVDPVKKSFILINIPSDTYIASTYGGGTSLNKIYLENGDAGLIDAISSVAEIGISHYVKTVNDGLFDLVDALDGIDVDLKEYVDDTSIDDTYIPKGVSKISGKQTSTLLKSTNFYGGSDVISDNQRQVCAGLLKAALQKTTTNIAVVIDKLAGDIKTDISSHDILSMISDFKEMDQNKILTCDVPGYKTIRNNIMVFMIDASEWKNLRTQISYGSLPPSEDDVSVQDITPSSVSIIIQNGAGIDGAGASLSETLQSYGFNVLSTGNADLSSYKETLIIYNGENLKNSAIAIKNTLKNGRIVNGDGLYSMKSDILIIIGADMKM